MIWGVVGRNWLKNMVPRYINLTQKNIGDVSELWIYPIKSCAGIQLKQSHLERTGLVNDRRYMLVEGNGKFITQRKYAQLARVKLSIEGHKLGLSIDGFGQSQLLLNSQKDALVRAKIWDDQVDCFEVDRDVSAFFSNFLGETVRLVQLAKPNGRTRQKNGLSYQSSFADATPVLVTSSSSLEAINKQYDLKIPMNRFRPNIVVTGWEEWQERGRDRINIANLDFNIAYDCTRCPVTTIDQNSGKKTGKYPLASLLEMFPGEPALFGLRSASNDEGLISVGDPCII